MIELIFDPALKAETWFDPTWFGAGWFDDELVETAVVPPVTARRSKRLWLKSQKDLYDIQRQIEREDEELVEFLTIFVNTGLLN